MGQPRFRSVKRCAFCEAKADSREHAWGDWAIQRFRRPGDKIAGEVGGLPYFDPLQKALRVKCVCVPCNTGWMKQLEDRVIPTAGLMMQDLTLSLDSPQLQALAMWAMKTAMVFEFITTDRALFYTDDERSALRVSGTIPPRTRIWLARSAGRETFYSRANDVSSPPGGPAVQGLVTTLGFRRLVIQIMTIRVEPYEGERFVLDGNHALWHDAKISCRRSWPCSVNTST